MSEDSSTQVLIVGGGPVGLVLAMCLARHGVEVMLLEQRPSEHLPGVKCNHVSARSMETFRQLGIADAVRHCGLPADFSNDVAYRTTTTGAELGRIHIPSRRDRFTDTSGPDGHWPTPEPPHRANQRYLEPVLRQCAAATRGVRLLMGARVDACSEHDNGVLTQATRCDNGEPMRIRSEFVVGCDGASSLVRRTIGATLRGDENIGRTQSTFIRAPGLLGLLRYPPAWATFSLNPRRCGNVYAIDGRELWLVHNYLRPSEISFDSVDRNRALRQILGVGDSFDCEILGREDWIARRLVADRFRLRRLFICGDAAHIWVPMAGYGMNAGIADAANLAWLLAARLNGWASDGMLDAYERERRPITDQVSHFAMNHALALQQQREAVPVDIEAAGPQGDTARAAAGQALVALNTPQYCCAGLNFGYFYGDSPIVAYDAERAPAYSMGMYTPSTVPGCRTPHLWLPDGRSLYDVSAGSGYVLLRFDANVDAEPLLAAARRRRVPLRLLDLDATHGAGLYRHALVISRPDQHVAWRGHAAPADPLTLIDRLRGAATTPTPCRRGASIP
jgi:2-polyprenyl-6-methoxyphenol hydroxylase-like FAD-dependent oxidoreductase